MIWGYKLSDRFKIQYGFIGLAIIILLLPLLAHFLGSTTAKYYSCFITLFVFGAFNGMVQASVFGLGGVLPGKYMGAIMFGNGISGISMNLLRIIFILTLPDDSLYL